MTAPSAPDPTIDLLLFDISSAMVGAWRAQFAADPGVQVLRCDLDELPEVDAVVAAGNSYGVMDGGLDAVMAHDWPGCDRDVARALAARGGYLPVGQALMVATSAPDQPAIVYTPTMRRPTPLTGRESQIYDATWAALWATALHADGARVRLAMPGLGTGVGQVSCVRAAALMHEAWKWFRARRSATVGVTSALHREGQLQRALER